ncbi:Dihydrofolate reductase [Cytospora mali]|uniref:Dihydrofolate reductase n=1 Tax=Cytospora mali TaxID=578113 RepID=A0A194W0Y3_CYTMA|nr:Dihydrofolate reductase [Valsa mali]
MGDINAAKASGGRPAADKKAQANDTKEIKILMLHGYTQSGPLFRAKTRALEKLMAKSLAPFKLKPTLFYPTAPTRLSPRDIPGYVPAEGAEAGEDAETDAWAWFRKDEASGNYRALSQGFECVARCIRDEAGGHVDGVVGFSQGGAMAAMLASALEHVGDGEGEYRVPPPADADYDWGWVDAVREANGGRGLKFAVVYSGFFSPPAQLGWLYEPKIKTATLQFIGSLDTVVEEDRSQGLVDRCQDPLVVVHPGGHHVPVKKEMVMPLVGFVKKCCEEDAPAS